MSIYIKYFIYTLHRCCYIYTHNNISLKRVPADFINPQEPCNRKNGTFDMWRTGYTPKNKIKYIYNNNNKQRRRRNMGVRFIIVTYARYT